MAKRSQRRAKGGRRRTQGKGWEFIPAERQAAANPAKRLRSEPPEAQRIAVRVERRKDKLVTVARGFQLTEADLKALGKTLKTRCSAGGKARDDAIEVQGEHRRTVGELLEAQGYRVQLR